MRLLTACLAAWAIVDITNGVSTKMGFNDEESTSVVTNSTTVDDEDVEVKHTIVVSTKLKNNNRKGIHSSNDGNSGTLTYSVGQKSSKKDEDSGEVPVVTGYKSVETTRIRTPDTRHKSQIYPEAIFVSRNIRDEYDNVYPNMAANPMQWKPSNFYNNVNYRSPDGRDFYLYYSHNNNERKGRPLYQNPKLHRKITEDGMREFYCKKCVELSHGQGLRGCSQAATVIQQRSANPWSQIQTTTPKMKIDGKLAKLN